ncbi:MAG TPA: hypothetical protein VHG88_07075 [Burkholderiales bacterium]|nr:hypothetical protein [Burkholderiales bacterium]
MRFAKPLLVASALALAFGAYAADDKQARAKDPEPGFNNLDANNDGSVSRAEYLMVKGKKDIGRAADAVKDAVSSDDKSSSTGSSAGSTSKK